MTGVCAVVQAGVTLDHHHHCHQHAVIDMFAIRASRHLGPSSPPQSPAALLPAPTQSRPLALPSGTLTEELSLGGQREKQQGVRDVPHTPLQSVRAHNEFNQSCNLLHPAPPPCSITDHCWHDQHPGAVHCAQPLTSQCCRQASSPALLLVGEAAHAFATTGATVSYTHLLAQGQWWACGQ
jgi:hypothetical protein